MRNLFFLLFAAVLLTGCASGPTHDIAAERTILLNDDGAWCWFEDERVIFNEGILWFGSIASGHKDPSRKGSVEVVGYDPQTGQTARHTLHQNLQLDDHDSPALWADSNGRLFAAYAKHGNENKVYFARSKSAAPDTAWEESRPFIPSAKTRLTYSNLHFLADENKPTGRLYNFFRGYDASFKPSYMFSDDEGESWQAGNVVINVPLAFKHRPYVKYASNGKDTVHLFYTEGHPRNFDNSVYHITYRNNVLHNSNGKTLQFLTEGLEKPEEGTLVFQGDADNVAWVSDLHLDADGHPYGAITVQKNSAGLPRGEGGADHRYRYARFDGAKWHTHEIAYAGTKLYAGEDDYTGNLSLDPDDPNTLYISTNVDPVTGAPQPSGHYEIYQGVTRDFGATWKWTPITQNSTVDNLRPIMPKSDGTHKALLWYRGVYHRYQLYETEVVAKIW